MVSYHVVHIKFPSKSQLSEWEFELLSLLITISSFGSLLFGQRQIHASVPSTVLTCTECLVYVTMIKNNKQMTVKLEESIQRIFIKISRPILNATTVKSKISVSYLLHMISNAKGGTDCSERIIKKKTETFLFSSDFKSVLIHLPTCTDSLRYGFHFSRRQCHPCLTPANATLLSLWPVRRGEATILLWNMSCC